MQLAGGIVEQHKPYRFRVGDVVHHRHYGYRGVVYGRDPGCQADEAWYLNNLSQPDRKQPWYHVLVHDHEHTTYVAQSNLVRDGSGEPIVHPLLDRIFTSRIGGRYDRESEN